ncbi:MAG TPA: glycosyltransferase family 2 protein [Candidatus Saccharimonadales bacterium]|nr:glycosyltransferase family 2 protein [Candidatus Saccharimonadales bacterium]
MAPEKLSVVAAIPNYNMADSLNALLSQVLEQEYDDVYVLDDASSDHSQEVAESWGSAVHFIAGRENLGAGGNRNRIIGALGRQALIHFLDADMILETERTPEIAREIMRPDAAFVGGLVKEHNGLQLIFNYGPRQSLRNDLRVPLHLQLFAWGAKGRNWNSSCATALPIRSITGPIRAAPSSPKKFSGSARQTC